MISEMDQGDLLRALIYVTVVILIMGALVYFGMPDPRRPE